MNQHEAITEAIKDYLAKLKWEYEFAEDGDAYFETGTELENSENGVLIRIVAGSRAYTVMAVPVLEEELTLEQMENVMKFLTIVNAHMLMGTLVLNAEERLLYVQLCQLCSGQIPDEETLEDSLMLPIAIADDLMPLLTQMCAGQLDPEEAAAQFLFPEEE